MMCKSSIPWSNSYGTLYREGMTPTCRSTGTKRTLNVVLEIFSLTQMIQRNWSNWNSIKSINSLFKKSRSTVVRYSLLYFSKTYLQSTSTILIPNNKDEISENGFCSWIYHGELINVRLLVPIPRKISNINDTNFIPWLWSLFFQKDYKVMMSTGEKRLKVWNFWTGRSSPRKIQH